MAGRLRTAAWVLLVILYVAAFPYHPGLRSPNELVRLHQTRALVEYGSIDINRALMDYGRVGDMSVKDGKYYPSKAPLLSFAATPIYYVLRILGGSHLYAVKEIPLVFWTRLFLTILPTLLMLWVLRRYLATYLPGPIADALVLTYALGTLAFSYSLLLMSHQPTAVLLFGAFYALWRCGRGDWRERGYLIAGAFAGATILAEYTGALAVVVLALYAALTFLIHHSVPLVSRLRGLARAAGLATLGALPFILALMAYHQAAFGHPLESGYKYLADAGYQHWHLGGFLGIRYPDPVAFVHSFFSPLRGHFTLSPFLLLALPGTALLFSATGKKGGSYQSLLAPEAKVSDGRFHPADRATFYFVVALFAAYAYFTSSFEHTSWGWTSGPRHLTGLVPFLLLPIGLVLVRARAAKSVLRFTAGGLAGLCAASILVTGAVSFVNYIPDNVSEPLFGLALPLFRTGHLSPSVFWLLGLGNPASGALLVTILLLLATICVWFIIKPAPEEPARLALGNAAVALAVVISFVALHGALARGDEADLGAEGFLRSVWLAPPGTPPSAP